MRLPRRRPSESVARPVAQFAAASLVAVAVLGVLGVLLLRQVGRDEAIRNAQEVTRVAALQVVEPRVAPGLVRGDDEAIARVDRAARAIIDRQERIVRIRIWRADGTILYSDVPEQIRTRFPLGEEEREILREGGVDAEVSHLDRAENRFEQDEDRLLEVYLPIRTPDGEPLLFESYQRFSSVTEDTRRLVVTLLPAAVGGLLVLALLQLPLAWSMARRLQAGRREREDLLRRALDASVDERRRIAADLHDGVVQELAAVAFNLSAAGHRAEDAPPDLRAALEDGAERSRHSMRQLRTLVVDIYPPDLHRAGLAAALSDLAEGVRAREIEPSVEVPAELDLPTDVEELLFRSAQEAVRNVVKYAGAHHLHVAVRRDDGTAVLEVSDDGRGFDPAAVPDGHLGLRLLADAAAESGGRLAVDSAPSAGTRLRLEVPV
jgi:two-component system, NarL family, sensor kinase